MSGTAGALREKHDGELGGASAEGSVRLWLRLLSCTMVLEKRVRRSLAEQFRTTLPRFDILAALDRAPDGLSMSALSRALLVSNGNITGLVQTLLRDGNVELATAPGDRRTAVVTLTRIGIQRFRAMADAHHDWIEAAFANLTPMESEQLLGLLGRLKISIAAAPALEIDA